MESWLSGLKRTPAKGVGEKSPRGFESLTLRNIVLARGNYYLSEFQF